MRLSRKKRNLILVVISILLILFMSLYASRNAILRHIIATRTARAEQAYGLQIKYQHLKLDGFNTIDLQGLSVLPYQRDTLLKLRSVDLELKFWKLIKGEIEIDNVSINGLDVRLIKQDSIANYDFLFAKQTPTEEQQPNTATDYAQRIDRVINLIYGFLPENGQLNQIEITERKDSNFVTIHIPSFCIKNNHFQSTIQIKEDTQPQQQWETIGELNRSIHSSRVTLFAPEHQKISLPYITRRFGAQVSFDTLSYSLTKSRGAAKQLSLSGKASIKGLDVYHKALSPEVIHLNRGQLNYHMNVDDHSFELDSTSSILFNQLQFSPYLRAEKRDKKWKFTAAVDKAWFSADDLFSSLPKGLFINLEHIKASGNLAYHFLLNLDFAQIDSLVFESELKKKDFRVLEGNASLAKMSGEFMYTAYEKGMPVRTFPVGPSWNHFTPLDSISPILRMSVLQSEDGAFFYHQGFLPDALKEALIYDLKVKRFARGGSTITMQLVKNVFLNRNKNFARKLEEALIVWLIESQRLTSKERMYEVYLNIVEWGPLIYGIHEAAAYYFNKRPSELNTEESIFLASIIPKPKHFRNSFAEGGQLKENMEGYYKLIATRLAKKGLISDAEADSIRPDIEVKGDALNSLPGQ